MAPNHPHKLRKIGIRVRWRQIRFLRRSTKKAIASWMTGTTWSIGFLVALISNLMNNLPVGLIAGSVIGVNQLPLQTVGAMLIGVDLGPNLSVTGSLATILWLVALRREGLEVRARSFLRVGALVMPPALLLSIITMILLSAKS
jgi:arsenical pump membrane protein